MSIISDIESRIKSNPNYGVTFSIDPEAYACNLSNERVCFGENHTFMNCGTTFNYQPVIVDGKEVGTLEEIQPYNIFEPLRTSFIVHLEEVSRKDKRSPHFELNSYDYPQLRFATLQQIIDYLGVK